MSYQRSQLAWLNYLAACKTLAISRFCSKSPFYYKARARERLDWSQESSDADREAFHAAEAAGEANAGDAGSARALPDPWASLRQRRPEEMPRPATKVSYFVWR